MILLASYSAFVAAMQRPMLAGDTDVAATLCFCASLWTINALKRQASPFVGTLNTGITGFRKEIFLWRVHREHLPANWLRKLNVLLWCAGICLFITGLTSEYYREHVLAAVLTIFSK
jgi:hypothetical protein